MLIIEGFQSAKSVLSRQVLTEFYPTSLTLELKSKRLPARDEAEREVRKIIDEVRKRGDSAVRAYTSKYDGLKLTSLEVSKEHIASAHRGVNAELVSALRLAAERIRSFHSVQKDKIWGDISRQGSGQLIRPLERIGLYVPGGAVPYPSTVLMTAIPAKVAGVNEVIMVTPPKANGAVPPSILVAADIAGVDRILSVGGAQAIAALAFGTESVPKVDKICGPGNIFVTLAKRLVYGVVDIDGLQGPSEVLIIADETADPRYCAADLLAQAEHDPLASAILITTSRQLADKINREVEQQLQELQCRAIATESLVAKGKIAVVADVDEAIELANLYAPEHLCLMVKEPNSHINKVSNAGCIVIGGKATVVLGDYVAGPSHVLPTGGTARFSSPLSVNDFTKLINWISIDGVDLKQLSRAAAIIARAEGLKAHAIAVEKRLESDS